MYVGNTMKHIQVGNVYDEDFEDSIINPILLGGLICPTSKIYYAIFNLAKVTQKCYQICARNLFS